MFTREEKDGIRILMLAHPSQSMNVIDEAFMDAYEAELKDLEANQDKLKGVIITSTKPEFIAGADLKMISKHTEFEAAKKFVWRLHDLFRRFELLKIPSVAAINGVALGGGYEVCLACHYRVALNSPKLQIGLPEVGLGLLPGAGGTQRLPRVIGFVKAIPLLMQGKKLRGEAVLAEGLVHELADSPEDLMAKAVKYITENPNSQQPWEDKKFRIPGGDVHTPKGYQHFAGASAMLEDKGRGCYPAPRAILRCVYEGLQMPFDKALEFEAKQFAKLAIGKESKMMIRSLFFGINQCNKGVSRPKEVEKKEIKEIAMLGAGMMGAGIAYVSAKAGIEVQLKDVKKESAEKGKAYSQKLLEKAVTRGFSTEAQAKALLDKIHPTEDPKCVANADLVVEAVFEDRGLKKKVTEESEAAMKDGAIFASNTSTLPITGLAEPSKRPENFIGLHFFSPVDKMPLVEIIKGEKTGPEAIARCFDYVRQIKKTPILVNDGRGFYTSRCFMTFVEEGIFALHDGVHPGVIENAGRAAGMPVGPLCVADEVSLDLVHHIAKQTMADLGEEAVSKELWQTAKLFVEELKRNGKKSGKGFYEYPEGGRKFLWPELSKHYPSKENVSSYEEMQERILTRQTIEAIRCMEDGVVMSPVDADVGSILGWGFPAYTGGAISYVEYVGAERFLERTERFAAKFGPRFAAPELLKTKVKSGKGFYD